MKNIIISGKIGSGKTTLLKKIFSSPGVSFHFYKISPPAYSINVDRIGHKCLNVSPAARKKIRYALTTGRKKTQNKKWHVLERLTHPCIFYTVQEIQSFYIQKKGTIIWECALDTLFFEKSIRRIQASEPSKYIRYKRLQKRRLSIKEMHIFLERQK